MGQPDQHINTQTEIVTTILNQPWGRFSEHFIFILIFNEDCNFFFFVRKAIIFSGFRILSAPFLTGLSIRHSTIATATTFEGTHSHTTYIH